MAHQVQWRLKESAYKSLSTKMEPEYTSIPDLNIPNRLPDLHNRPRTLMTQHNRARQNKIPNSAALPIMHVAATDTSLLDVHTDIMIITQFRDFAVLNRDVFDAV